MGVSDASINNIMGGIENTGGVRMHNHKKKLKQRFDIIKKLGQGTYGKVQLGINKETGQEVAIKTIKKSKIQLEADLVRIRREIQIMSSVQHPNIIHIYEVFENREKMVLVMEYAAGGELYDYLSERKVLPEEEARRIFRQIATACYYCHKHKICHRDLKLENILLDENNNAKIADFGLSNVFDDQRLLNTFCGSPLYASPEIVRGTPYHGPEVDCWSLGVLLYTLVYGAMPFDGSNFKRLVKQISQGDYFEPQKPSPASPLIREMLTVNPRNRADIEKICAHWWVNENYDVSCLEISEELANQTPVRLDLLLSLAPPPPQLESEKLVVTGEAVEDTKPEVALPTRSQSAGSLLELTHPAEKRIKELIKEEKASPKRKLEATVSTDRANIPENSKRKEKIIKENTIADITVHGTIQENASQEDASMAEMPPLNKSLTQTLSRDMDFEPSVTTEPALEGAACAEIIKEANLTNSNINKNPSVEETPEIATKKETPVGGVNKENVQENPPKEKTEVKTQEAAPTVKKKIIKKKVLSDKNDNVKQKSVEAKEPEKIKNVEKTENNNNKTDATKPEEPPPKQVERRRSRIFETAEKFQNLISGNENKIASTSEKPKKIIIPGVSVDGFKKEFERKASLTSETPPPNLKSAALRKKSSVDLNNKSLDEETIKEKSPEVKESAETKVDEPVNKVAVSESVENKAANEEEDKERKERVKNAVSIISSALDKEGTRKSKSRPCMVRKPPIPFGASGRSASASIGMVSTPFSPTEEKQCFKVQVGPNASDTRIATVEVSTPEHTRYAKEPPEADEENKTSSAEITLKSATLPRRKTTKAEIRLDYPTPKPATMEFKTEMATHVEAAPKLATQRSEVTFPVTSPPRVDFRASSLEPDNKANKSREHIIPISFEDSNKKETVQSPPPTKPPTPRMFQNQKSYQSQRSGSLSRQSTQESDTETTSSREPIRKSPREYIIPIAVEGGGYVTPRAGSLEPSESTTSTMTNNSRRSKFGSKLGRRLDSVFGDRDSEDESPFSSLHRHSSFGRESDTEDSKRDAFHMHRLRSSRPRKTNLEHNDSLSSGEDDDDDGFEILTAENLFSTLLSRVRDLTQRLNVEDGGRPGFPSSRLLSHFDHGTNFWNMHNRLDPLSRPLGRTFSQESSTTANSNNQFGVPWRRSVSRDLASDIESIFKNPTPTHTSTLPRGDAKKENLNLSDLDLKKLKLSDEDALALSYLTPGLSKRIQKQLFSQLAPSEARKLSRTLSMQNENRNPTTKSSDESTSSYGHRSFDRISSTLPRRCSIDKYLKDTANAKVSNEGKVEEAKTNDSARKSFLPVKSRIREEFSPLNDRNTQSENTEYKRYEYNNKDTISDGILNYHRRPRVARSISLREPKVDTYYSPDSSISDRNDDSYKNTDSDVSSKIYGQDYASSNPLYGPELSTLSKYLSSNKHYETTPDKNKTEIKRPSYSTRKISRFLRPDFYDVPKEESTYLKEKKEREMETQKVLKEIRDKRIKNRINMRRERSVSRENCGENRQVKEANVDVPMVSSTDALLKTVSDNIKKLESNVKTVPTYVNVIVEDTNNTTNEADKNVIKKERVSKLVRPKSYPTESYLQEATPKPTISPEKEQKSKISRLKKASPTSKAPKIEENEKEKTKNKFLQTIEKKFEKLRSLSNTPTTDSNDDCKTEKKSVGVENTIKRLREQSLPRNLEHCTESGLIKRAVSVEDLPSGNSKTLQASRKSVSKILGLFKKYEERDLKKNEKLKTKKSKENKKENADAVISTDKNSQKKKVQKAVSVDGCDNTNSGKPTDEIQVNKKPERPRSLLFDRKHFNGAKSDTILNDDNTKKVSKLPVNSSMRRSLNLENATPPSNSLNLDEKKPDRRSLKLDLSKLPTRNKEPLIYVEPTPSTSAETPQDFKQYRNSLGVNEDSSVFLSPCDDASCDSWSVCSDYCNNELSPVSPNGHIYSGDENESVIDRIRRKSFYTRFNEKKRPRKTSLSSYKDLDLYKDVSVRKGSCYKPPANDYGSFDRRSVDYRFPVNRYSIQQEPSRKSYERNTLLSHDGYVNVPNRYQTYNLRINRHVSPLYSDYEDNNVDDITSGRIRKYSSHSKPSSVILGRSISPMSEQSFEETSSSSFMPTSINSPTSLNPQ